mgnify:CR=1 FL=1
MSKAIDERIGAGAFGTARVGAYSGLAGAGYWVQWFTDESARTADDSAYAMFKTDTGVFCQFNSSWNVRVRRDDLLVMQVDGTKGSAIVGLRKCWAQSMADTPKPVWNPDIESPIDYFQDWSPVPTRDPVQNAFKAQWELYIRYVIEGGEFPWDLLEGAKGVQLAEESIRSHVEKCWIDLEDLK